MPIQVRPKGYAGRMYAPERDLLNALPALISRALDDACDLKADEEVAKVGKHFADHYKLARNPDLTIEEVMKMYEEYTRKLDYNTFCVVACSFVKVMMNYHVAAMRQMPVKKKDQDISEEYLLAVHNFVVRYNRWPWWRKLIYKTKRYFRNLLAEPSDILDAPVIGTPGSENSKEVSTESTNS